jgi:hypothetical protein
MTRAGRLTWRAAQIYLVLLAIIAIATAAWTYGYWTRGRSYFGETLPRLAERVPGLIKETVAKNPVEGAVETPALLLWAFGPIAIPVVALGAALLLIYVSRRRRAALAFTLLVAAAVVPVAYGGVRALRQIEDRHFYARSPYVRVYHYLAVPLVAASGALWLLVAFDGLVLARRRPPAA